MKDLEATEEELKPVRLLTFAQVGKLLSVSDRWIRFRVENGELSAVKLIGVSRISLTELERFIREKPRPLHFKRTRK